MCIYIYIYCIIYISIYIYTHIYIYCENVQGLPNERKTPVIAALTWKLFEPMRRCATNSFDKTLPEARLQPPKKTSGFQSSSKLFTSIHIISTSNFFASMELRTELQTALLCSTARAK